MKDKKEEEKLVKISFRIPLYKKKMIYKAVEKSGYNNASELIRAGVDKELNLQIYKDNLDFIVKEIDREIEAKLNPFIKSQRSLNAKYTRSSAINTYLLAEIMEKLLRDDLKDDFKYSLKVARQKANLYVNKKVDENMKDEDILDYYSIGDLYRNE